MATNEKKGLGFNASSIATLALLFGHSIPPFAAAMFVWERFEEKRKMDKDPTKWKLAN